MEDHDRLRLHHEEQEWEQVLLWLWVLLRGLWEELQDLLLVQELHDLVRVLDLARVLLVQEQVQLDRVVQILLPVV